MPPIAVPFQVCREKGVIPTSAPSRDVGENWSSDELEQGFGWRLKEKTPSPTIPHAQGDCGDARVLGPPKLRKSKHPLTSIERVFGIYGKRAMFMLLPFFAAG
jgi:hypothetical protein